MALEALQVVDRILEGFHEALAFMIDELLAEEDQAHADDERDEREHQAEFADGGGRATEEDAPRCEKRNEKDAGDGEPLRPVAAEFLPDGILIGGERHAARHHAEHAEPEESYDVGEIVDAARGVGAGERCPGDYQESDRVHDGDAEQMRVDFSPGAARLQQQEGEAADVDDIFADVGLPAADQVELRIGRDVNPGERGEGVNVKPGGGEQRKIDDAVAKSIAHPARVRLQR